MFNTNIVLPLGQDSYAVMNELAVGKMLYLITEQRRAKPLRLHTRVHVCSLAIGKCFGST
jgi:hypothetical protein